MKKFLSILASIGLTSTAAISVVACGDKKVVVETINKTTDELSYAADGQSATLELSSEEALKLGLVQRSDDGYTNGANLPEAGQTVPVNRVNITATFTPDLKSGVVLVTLRAEGVMHSRASLTFTLGDGKAKLNIIDLYLDFEVRTIMQKSAVLGDDHQSATLKLTTDETLALGLTEEVAPGAYQYGRNYPNSTNGGIAVTLGNGTKITGQIVLSLSDATGSIKLESNKPMDGNTNISLIFNNQILVINYNVTKSALMNSDHQSATLTLTPQEALQLGLVKTSKSESPGPVDPSHPGRPGEVVSVINYNNGENWAPTFSAKLGSATITASVPSLDSSPVRPDGSVLITLTIDQAMSKTSDVEFRIGSFKFIVKQLNLDFKTIAKTITLDESSPSATTKLTTDETLVLGLMDEVAPGSYQFGKNYYSRLTNGKIETVLDDGTNITTQFELSPSDATGSIKITSDKAISRNTVLNFNFGDYSLIIKINFVNDPETTLNRVVNNDANHETATLTLTQNEALALKLTQINSDGTIQKGSNWRESYWWWNVGTNSVYVTANFELKEWTHEVKITFSVDKPMLNSEKLNLILGSGQESKGLLIISDLKLDYVRTDPTILQKYPTVLASDHQSASFDLTFSEALSLKLAVDEQGVISRGSNWPANNQLTTQLTDGTKITAKLTWKENGSVEVTLTSSQKMAQKTDVSFDFNQDDQPLVRLLVGGLNLDYDAEVKISKTASDVKISADGKTATLTLTALEAESLKITPSPGMATYLSESAPQVMAKPSFNEDGSVELGLIPLEVMGTPSTVSFDFGYPDYSAKKLVIKDLQLDLVGEVTRQGSELTIDPKIKLQAKLTLTAAETRSLGLSRVDYVEHQSTTTPIVKATLDLNDPFVFTFIFTAPEPITTPVTVSFNFAEPGQTPKTLTIQDFILN